MSWWGERTREPVFLPFFEDQGSTESPPSAVLLRRTGHPTDDGPHARRKSRRTLSVNPLGRASSRALIPVHERSGLDGVSPHRSRPQGMCKSRRKLPLNVCPRLACSLRPHFFSTACPIFLSGSMLNRSPMTAIFSGLILPTMLMNTASRLLSMTVTTTPSTASSPRVLR